MKTNPRAGDEYRNALRQGMSQSEAMVYATRDINRKPGNTWSVDELEQHLANRSSYGLEGERLFDVNEAFPELNNIEQALADVAQWADNYVPVPTKPTLASRTYGGQHTLDELNALGLPAQMMQARLIEQPDSVGSQGQHAVDITGFCYADYAIDGAAMKLTPEQAEMAYRLVMDEMNNPAKFIQRFGMMTDPTPEPSAWQIFLEGGIQGLRNLTDPAYQVLFQVKDLIATGDDWLSHQLFGKPLGDVKYYSRAGQYASAGGSFDTEMLRYSLGHHPVGMVEFGLYDTGVGLSQGDYLGATNGALEATFGYWGLRGSGGASLREISYNMYDDGSSILNSLYSRMEITSPRFGVGQRGSIDLDALVKNNVGAVTREGIVSDLGSVVQPHLKTISNLDPDAMVGFRGSLARGFKGEHKGGAPFDVKEFDVDAFIVSDKLAAEFGKKARFRDAADIPELENVQVSIDAALRKNPAFSGLRQEPFTFRIFTQQEILKLQAKPDAQYFFIRSQQP